MLLLKEMGKIGKRKEKWHHYSTAIAELYNNYYTSIILIKVKTNVTSELYNYNHNLWTYYHINQETSLQPLFKQKVYKHTPHIKINQCLTDTSNQCLPNVSLILTDTIIQEPY